MKKLKSLLIFTAITSILFIGINYSNALKVDTAKPIIKVSSLQKNLVLHMPLDEESLQSATTFADKTPYENTGTKYGSVLKFDGTSDYVEIADNASLNSENNFSVSAWIKPSLNSAFLGIAGKMDKFGIGDKEGWVFRINDLNQLDFFTRDNSDINSHNYDMTVYDGIWTHVAGIFDGTNNILYVNGTQVASVTNSYAPSTNKLLIGSYVWGSVADNDGGPYYFNGSIGDTRIYSRTLSPAEVLTMYQGGVVSETGLVAHYKFKDKSGNVLTDETTVNNGALTNFANTTAEYGNTHDSGWVTDDTPNVFTTDRKGHSGKAMSFDDESDYVRIADSENLSPTSAMSLFVWVKGASGQALSRYDYGIDQRSYYIGSLSNKMRIVISDDGTFDSGHIKEYISSIVAFDNTWHLVGFTFDAGTLKLYIDGVEDTSPTKTADGAITTIHNSTADVTVGSYLNSDAPESFFDGSLSDVRIYNRALNTQEITSLYEDYRPKIVSGDINKGLVAHYPLSQEDLKSATVIADKTPNENDGTLNGTSFTTDRKGQANRAMSFNGTSDFVDCGDNSSIDFSGSDYSSSVWIKFNELGSMQIYGKDFSSYTPAGGLSYINSEYRIRHTTNNANYDDVFHNTTPNTGQWYHLVVTYYQSTKGVTFYIDGDSVRTETMTYDFDRTGVPLTLGSNRRSGNYQDWFNGDIADVRIYNRVLSQQEIQTLYESYRPKISAGSLQKGLVLDMPLTSERYNAGTTTFDDKTPYENRGANTGGDVDVDHTTFVSASSDNVRIDDSASLSPTSAMSSFIWVKGAEDVGYVLAHYEITGDERTFAIQSNANIPKNKHRVVLSETGTFNSSKAYESSIVSFDNTWHLVGFTFDAGTLKLFVDGVEDTSPYKQVDPEFTTIHNSTADVMVGSYLNNNTPTGLFDGDLSGAKIWNRALSPQEVLSLYTRGR